jgi:hypothetical protein
VSFLSLDPVWEKSRAEIRNPGMNIPDFMFEYQFFGLKILLKKLFGSGSGIKIPGNTDSTGMFLPEMLRT